MARVKDILNQWGRQGGPNPQRTDLWQVDLSEVINGLNDIPGLDPYLPQLPRYFAASVTLPEQKVRAEAFRRDSRSYNMPVWDEPLDSIRMTFVVDDGGKAVNTDSQAAQSTIYTILDVWRSAVRAGRGGVGSETSIRLDANYRIEYAWPVYVYLLKGQTLPAAFTNSTVTKVNTNSQTLESTFEGGFVSEELATATQVLAASGFADYYSQQSGLEVSGILRLENTWLSSFKIGDLTYERSGVLTIEATVYAENILQVRRTENVPSFT